MSEPKDILIGRNIGNPDGNPTGVNHLLVIAIDDYQFCPKLNNCVRDAEDFTRLLVEKYRFEQSNTQSLVNNNANRKTILDTIRDLRQKVKPQDNLLIYYSGHGQTVDGVGYLIPVDAQPDSDADFVSANDLKNRLDQIGCFHIVLLVDACFSGSLFSSFKNATTHVAGENRRSRSGLAASHSREQALDGNPGENSPFANRLIRNLRENEHPLGMQALASRVIDEVHRLSENRQTPVYKSLNVRGDDAGQFVFHPRKWDEEKAWALVLQDISMERLDNFLTVFPKGVHSDEARVYRKELLEEQEFETLKAKPTIEKGLSYLRRFPQSQWLPKVRLIIQELEEEKEWVIASQQNTISAYLGFLGKFPSSKFAAEANFKIESLKNSVPPNPILPRKEEIDPPVTPPSPIPPSEKENPSTEGKSRMLLWIPLSIVVLFLIIWGVKNAGFPPHQENQELSEFQKASALNTISAWNAFLTQFPDGEKSEVARNYLKTLDTKLENKLSDAQLLINAEEFDAASLALDTAFQIKPDDARIQNLRDKLYQ